MCCSVLVQSAPRVPMDESIVVNLAHVDAPKAGFLLNQLLLFKTKNMSFMLDPYLVLRSLWQWCYC